MTIKIRLVVFVLLCSAVPATAQTTAAQLGIKYMRDSEEYAALARQTYRLAGEAVTRAVSTGSAAPWAVVLDVDETALDNSAYMLERAAYGLPFETVSWNAWIGRRRAADVPGVVEFIALVRRAGGRVAWITNRDATMTEATRANLEAVGLWSAQDRICAQQNPNHTKAQRRHEVVTGTGDCSWTGTPTRVVAFIGDQITDFPTAAEQIPQTGTDAAFGHVCFLLPNSMYGGWTTQVTRRP